MVENQIIGKSEREEIKLVPKNSIKGGRLVGQDPYCYETFILLWVTQIEQIEY